MQGEATAIEILHQLRKGSFSQFGKNNPRVGIAYQVLWDAERYLEGIPPRMPGRNVRYFSSMSDEIPGPAHTCVDNPSLVCDACRR
jgi:hypothetical protein